MSGEPQGALKVRKREPLKKFRDDDDWWGSPQSRGRAARTPFKGFPFLN